MAGLALAGAIGVGLVPDARRQRWLRAATATGVILLLLSLDAVSTTLAEVRRAWPDRANRAAIVDAVPRGASVAVPEYYFAPLSGRQDLFAIPNPFVDVSETTEWGAAETAAALAGLDAVIDDAALGERLPAETLAQYGFHAAVRHGEITLYLR